MGESCVNGKAREKCHFKDGTMRKGRMLCSKEFNLAQKEVWPLSVADNDSEGAGHTRETNGWI